MFSLNFHYLDLFVLVRPFNDWQAMWIYNTKTSNGIWITEVELFFCSWLYKLDIRIILCYRWSAQIKPYAYKTWPVQSYKTITHEWFFCLDVKFQRKLEKYLPCYEQLIYIILIFIFVSVKEDTQETHCIFIREINII